jgi:hypothetical protein
LPGWYISTTTYGLEPNAAAVYDLKLNTELQLVAEYESTAPLQERDAAHASSGTKVATIFVGTAGHLQSPAFVS